MILTLHPHPATCARARTAACGWCFHLAPRPTSSSPIVARAGANGGGRAPKQIALLLESLQRSGIQQQVRGPDQHPLGRIGDREPGLAAQRHDPPETRLLVAWTHPAEHPHQFRHRHLDHPGHRLVTTDDRWDARHDMQMSRRCPARHIGRVTAPAHGDFVDREECDRRQRHWETPFRHAASFGQGRRHAGYK